MKPDQIRENVVNYLKQIDCVNESGKYNGTISSLYQYKVPNWFTNAKLGIFIHYGLFSMAEFSEWYPHRMYIPTEASYEHHRKIKGNQNQHGYTSYIEDFTAKGFNASELIQIIEKMNAKYFLITAEHHDGFALYDTEFSDYNSLKMGPKIDFVQTLKQHTKEEINFGISSHRAAHYWFQGGARKFGCEFEKIEYGNILWPAQEGDSIYKDNEINTWFLEDWLARSCEIVDKYMPKVYYFDWWLEMEPFKPYVIKFLSYYYNRTLEHYGEEGVVTYKHSTVPYGVAVKDMERGNYSSMQKDLWQGCTALGRKSWSYTLTNEYKQPKEIIQQFIDLISKNGNLVLNIGPTKDGSISQSEMSIINDIANWINIHKSAIFKTKPWLVFGEGTTNCHEGKFSEATLPYKKSDIRYVYKENIVYAFIMDPQNETHFELQKFAKTNGAFTHHGVISDVYPITSGINICNYERRESSLQINIEQIETNLPIVFAIVTN